MNRLQVTLAIACSICACLVGAAPAPTTYLCVGEQATGFSMDQRSHKWKADAFRPREYVIKLPVKGDGAPSGASTAVLAVYEIGNSDPFDATAFCDKDFNDEGFLFCQGLGDDFKFNRQTLRFLRSFPFGYIDPPKNSFWGPEGSATPFLEIGTCSAL